MRFSYTAAKSGGRFTGNVYVTEDGDTKLIGQFENIKTRRGVKGLAKSTAEKYKRDESVPASHAESHTVYGDFGV